MNAARMLQLSRLRVTTSQKTIPCNIRNSSKLRNIRLRIAATDEQQALHSVGQDPEVASFVQPTRRPLPEVDPALARELELEELDSAQEHLLNWMMRSEEEQEQDLDEMVDYDEFGDEEYEEMFEEVQELLETSDAELKVGDKVVGAVYEVDEDGAYVEIGQKYSGFVPLSECSFARLKTVSVQLHA
jgi:small subunit ribosomal protein S1